MPKIVHETTTEREQEMLRRVARTRAIAASVAPPSRAEKHHDREHQARRAAARCGCPNTEIGSVPTQRGEWVGVVFIRPDQEWMRRQIEERGCRAVVLP